MTIDIAGVQKLPKANPAQTMTAASSNAFEGHGNRTVTTAEAASAAQSGSNLPCRSERRPSTGAQPASSAAETRKVAPMASAPKPRSARRSGASTPSVPKRSAGRTTNQNAIITRRSPNARTSVESGCGSSGRGACVAAAHAASASEATPTTANALRGPTMEAAPPSTGPKSAPAIAAAKAEPISAPRRPAGAAATHAPRPDEPQPLSTLVRAFGDRRVMIAFWFVVLPALLFGTLGVLAPLRLSDLGFGALAIGATFLVSAALEAANNVVLGRASDRYGPLTPIRAGLVASAVVAALLPWPGNRFVLALLVVCAGLAFGTFFTPGMTLLTHAAEERGLDYGYAFALVNLAWAPGQSGGAAFGGAVAEATRDVVPYLALSGVCVLTLAGLWRFASSS